MDPTAGMLKASVRRLADKLATGGIDYSVNCSMLLGVALCANIPEKADRDPPTYCRTSACCSHPAGKQSVGAFGSKIPTRPRRAPSVYGPVPLARRHRDPPGA